ncbi:hypothetical protein [Thermosynechococcus sp. PKX82]|uniref:hypothetical protein n=1 Tax=Thermosynechococcus sp. PKX82 TaxID=3074086 RepID=UPI00287302A1|nr:hypothetical protein [Thermosynechococcus sp. PKX82]WNC30357.1 hypothetical protein RHH53_02045 [Thermosynechococcus sp. PKX82]
MATTKNQGGNSALQIGRNGLKRQNGLQIADKGFELGNARARYVLLSNFKGHRAIVAFHGFEEVRQHSPVFAARSRASSEFKKSDKTALLSTLGASPRD